MEEEADQRMVAARKRGKHGISIFYSFRKEAKKKKEDNTIAVWSSCSAKVPKGGKKKNLAQ